MGFIRKTSRKTGKLKTLLGLAVSRIAVARRPRLARKSIATDDVRQLLTLGHLDRAVHRVHIYDIFLGRHECHEVRDHIALQCKLPQIICLDFASQAEQVIAEDNMLEAFELIELYCKRLIENASKLDKPSECTEDIQEAAAAVMFAASWCGDLPELPFARTILADKFGNDFAEAAKDGSGIVDPMLVWKLSDNATSMELKKKVTKEIAMENNLIVDFSELQEEMKDGED
uniref:Uncharacterized protein n=1 Tax=Leersia perrieri TaxID=77586 RepID=A0A0D9VS37_9ORYZ